MILFTSTRRICSYPQLRKGSCTCQGMNGSARVWEVTESSGEADHSHLSADVEPVWTEGYPWAVDHFTEIQGWNGSEESSSARISTIIAFFFFLFLF